MSLDPKLPATTPEAAQAQRIADLEALVAGIRRSDLTGGAAAPELPVGSLVPYAGAGAPSGYLLCDGSAVSRTTYADLWDVLRNGTGSSPYGNGDGSTTFNLPDLRGRVPVGEDGAAGRLTASDARGNSSGAEKHTLAANESGLPQHKHTAIRGGGYTLGYGATAASGAAQNAINASTNLMETNDAGPTAAANAHNNMQPFQIANYLIKT